MRLLFCVLLQAALFAAPEIPVTIRGGPDASAFFVPRAKLIASELLAGSGVQLRWVNRDEPGVTVITLEHAAGNDGNYGPLGAAKLYEGAHIRISLPRLQTLTRDSHVPELLAHVMVHEIAQILQAVDMHAVEGIMKAKWGPAEFKAITARGLRFTAADIELIHSGIERRKNSRADLSIQGSDYALWKRQTLP